MDLLMDLGILALAKLSKHSIISVGVLVILLFAGALLVQVGALLIAMTDYAASSINTAAISISSLYTGRMFLQFAMKTTDYGAQCPAVDDLGTTLVNMDFLFDISVVYSQLEAQRHATMPTYVTPPLQCNVQRGDGPKTLCGVGKNCGLADDLS
jgi:hypothetical protein